MGKQKPETKDWLGEDIEDGICDDLRVNVGDACTISNTPDAASSQYGCVRNG